MAICIILYIFAVIFLSWLVFFDPLGAEDITKYHWDGPYDYRDSFVRHISKLEYSGVFWRFLFILIIIIPCFIIFVEFMANHDQHVKNIKPKQPFAKYFSKEGTISPTTKDQL